MDTLKPQIPNIMAICLGCKTELSPEHDFCPECGTPRNTAKYINCSNCSAKLQENQIFCTHCGQKAGLNIDSNLCSAINEFNTSVVKKNTKANVIIGAVVLALLLLISGVRSSQKKILSSKLQACEWMTVSDDTILFLDFGDNMIDYNGHFGILGRQSITKLRYTVTGGNTIQVGNRTIKVEFDNDLVIFTPSFIDSNIYSIWVKN